MCANLLRSITHLECQMIETNMLPIISVAEGERLKEFIQYLKPKYIMPSTATVTKCTAKQFEEKKDELKVKLSNEPDSLKIKKET